MDITLDKKNSTEALIKVTLKENDYQSNVEEKVKDYARKANIKGFRPGKVPTGLIRKMYGKSILAEEVNTLLSKSLSDYIKENKIQIIGEPLPNMEKAEKIDWDNQKEFEFDYDIGLVDHFEYDLSKKTKVDSYKIESDQKTIDETLDNVKKQFGKVINPEVSEAGDDFYGEIKEVEGELSNEGLLKWEDISKKEQKKFVGLKSGDSIEFDIKEVLEDEHAIAHLVDVGHDKANEVSGKFSLTLKNINRTEPAEINQELFDKVFGPNGVNNDEEFIQKVKETVEDNYKRESDYFLDHNIRQQLIKNTKIEVPSEFLKKWLLASNEGKITLDDIERELDQYIESLKWDLLRNKIAEDSEIKVENEEIVDRAKIMILQQLGGQGMADQLKDHMDAFADNYLKGENGQNYMKVYNEVRDEKILAFIKESITLKEKKVDIEEFKKIVSK